MAANELDDWSTKEKFVLACCVTRSGDQNWVSVSRTMRLILEACEEEKKRPADWFSQKNFAIKYNELLNTASVAKRKVRGASSESGNVETPAEQILRKLTFERIEELDRVIKAERERYKKLKSDIHKIQSGKLDDELPRILQAIQSDQNVQLEQLIKEDPPLEELSVKTTLQAASAVSSSPASQNTPSRPQRAAKETEKFKSYIEQRQKHNAKYHHTPTTTSTSTAVTSTVVSSSVSSSITTSADVSLFATTVGPSPAQVQNMTVKHDSVGSIVQPRGLLITKPEQQQQHVNISVPSTPVRTAAAEAKEKSFLSNLLSSPASEIKAQVQHINNTLKEPIKNPHHVTKESYEAYKKAQPADTKGHGTAPMLSKLLEANNAPPSVTIPSNNVKLPTPQAAAKSVPAKGTLNEPIKTAPSKSEQIKPVTLQTSVPPLKTNTPKSVTKKNEPEVKQTDSKVSPSLAADVKSEVKPSPETKVAPTPKIAPLNEPINSKSSKRKLSETKSEDKKELAKTELVEKEPIKKEPIKKESVKKEPIKKEPVKKEPVKKEPVKKEPIKIELIKEEPREEAPPISKTKEVKPEAEAETNVKTQEVVKKGRTPSKTEPLTIEVNESERKKNETVSVDSTPEEPPPKKRVVEQIAASDHLELPLATSPKNKKKKGRAGRGRKKTLSGSLKVDIVSEEDLERSEEAEPDVSADLKDSELDTTDDSIDRKVKTPLTPSIPSPASPALSTGSNCDPETVQQQRAWRKSIMLVWKAAASHKYANVFLHPVTDEEAPGYSSIIFRPMDLSLIKKNIETGVIHTTTEFQRDIMLMFQNALMYNRKEHDVYRMAQEMRDDVMEQIQSFISTQLMVQTTERDSKFLRGKIDAPGHTRQSSKSGFTFLSL